MILDDSVLSFFELLKGLTLEQRDAEIKSFLRKIEYRCANYDAVKDQPTVESSGDEFSGDAIPPEMKGAYRDDFLDIDEDMRPVWVDKLPNRPKNLDKITAEDDGIPPNARGSYYEDYVDIDEDMRPRWVYRLPNRP